MTSGEKDEIIRARVSKAVKSDFEAISILFDKSPTDQLRELVEEFIEQHSSRLVDRVTVNISRPANYDYGAWRATIKLRRPEEGLWLGSEIPFPLPELPKRRISSDPEYLGIVIRDDIPRLGGKFINGEWRGHIYTNGIPEDQNPTTIDKVQGELHRLVIEVIDRFGRKNGS